MSSPHPEAVALIREHYGDPEWLVVRSDGSGHELLAPGTAVVFARDGQGRPVAGLACSFRSDFSITYSEGWETDENGACRAELKSTGYWIELSRGIGEAREVLGVGRLVVVAGKEARIDVLIASE